MNLATPLLDVGRAPGAPDITGVEGRLAELEGAEAAVVLASGTAATVCTMLALLRPGDHLVASAWLYGETRRFFERELLTIGIDVSFIDPTELRAWRRAIRPNTRALFLESPVNPTTRLVNLAHVRGLTREHGIALVVDSTFATPINCRPLERGADVVVHSATEYLMADGAGSAGVVCGSESFVAEVREKMAVWGPQPDVAAIQRLERGLTTLALRVLQQNSSALRIAQWAEQHAAVERVLYPGLRSHPDHALAGEMCTGFGSLIALTMVGGADAAERLTSRVSRFERSAARGGVASLIRLPQKTSHLSLLHAQRMDVGVHEGLVQLHVGIERVDDLIADLSQALDS